MRTLGRKKSIRKGVKIKMATAKKAETVTMTPLKIAHVKVRIVGDTPLIVHAWSEKAKREMLEAQVGSKKKIKKRESKNPFDDFARALYWMTEMPTETIKDPGTREDREAVTEELFDEAIKNGAKFGFPANSFKQAANAAAYRLGWVPNQMALRGSYFLNAEDGGFLVEIKGDKPMLREDMVRVGMGTADIRYRPIFENWYCDMILEYNASGAMSLEDILNCINAGGYAVGAGEWRPEKDGQFGRFHVEIVK